MTNRLPLAGVIASALAFASLLALPARAQQPAIGIAPVSLDADSYVFDTAEQHGIRVDVVVRGLVRPFSLAFLPGGDALVTERGTRLRLVRNATGNGTPELVQAPITGTPDGEGVRGAGLQDIVLHPDFAQNRLVYFSWNRPGAADPRPAARGQRLAEVVIARARFDGMALTEVTEIFRGGERPGASGSRLAFGADGLLYVTTGAPFTEEAGDPANVYGKVLRLRDDGSVPDDNPYAGREGTRPEVFSIGHRDQLGLTVHPASGLVFATDHGPNGGDEVNVIRPGRHYGWPDYSYGRTYEGPRVSSVPLGPDTEQPLLVWLPSIAPTGMTFYVNGRIPAWNGNLFIGSGRRGGIPRTGGLERVVFNAFMEELRRETLLTELHQRIRDVRQGPDGLLYVITDEENGALLRISPTG